MSYLEISRRVLPPAEDEKRSREREGGAGALDAIHVMTSMPVTKGFLSQVSTLEARHSSEIIDIPLDTPWRCDVRKLHLENPASVATV